MKSDLLTIIKKEMARFFGDKRMLFTAVMPGILIYCIYSVMGTGFSEMNHVEEDYNYQIQVVDLPQSLISLKDAENITIIEKDAMSETEIEAAKASIKNSDIDILVVFPENFDEKWMAYSPVLSSYPPNVEIYFDSTDSESSNAYRYIVTVLDQLEQSVSNKFDVCAGEKQYDLATNEDLSTMMVSMVLPMLVMTFIFSGCMSAASESIAGEKERGTIATLLVTPMNRRDLALGKLISLSVIGLISGTSSFVGTMLSLPKLMMGSGLEEVTLGYTVTDYAILAGVILSTTLIIVGVISILSAYAKSVKEAGTLATPLMMLTMVLSFSNMFGAAPAEKWYLYMFPLYNSVQCMGSIFAMDYQVLPVVITIISNLVVTGGLVVVLTKMFSSERIMYTQ